MPLHGYSSSPLCGCMHCEALIQGHVQVYCSHLCTPTTADNCTKAHPQTPTQMYTQTHTPYKQNTRQPCGHRLLPKCTHLKIPMPGSHLHVHLHWDSTRTPILILTHKYFYTCPAPDTNLSRHTLIHTHTHITEHVPAPVTSICTTATYHSF